MTALDNQKGHNIPDVFSLNFGKTLDTKGCIEDERKKKATTTFSHSDAFLLCAKRAKRGAASAKSRLAAEGLSALLSVSSLFDALLTVALALTVG